MSQPKDSIGVKLALRYLDSFDEDPLLNLKDIRQYSEPNFIGNNGRFYLCRCYECPDASDRGSDNYHPNRALGICTWCGWKPDTEIVAYIYSQMVVAGKADINELREIKVDVQDIEQMPDMRGMTIEEIERRYPAQHGMAKRGINYGILDEDDGYPD
jgi:hypothetical protein